MEKSKKYKEGYNDAIAEVVMYLTGYFIYLAIPSEIKDHIIKIISAFKPEG